MVEIAERLQQFGERLAYVAEASPRAPERRRAAEDVEYLCKNLYRHIAEYGSGSLMAFPPDGRKVEGTRIHEPKLINGSTIVPLLESRTMRLAGEMLTKTALYSELSVVVTPTTIEDLSIGYSLGPPGTEMDRREYETGYNLIFDYNMPYRSLVAAGRCVFLPRLYRKENEDMNGSWGCDDFTAPLLQNPNEMRYLPTNLSPTSWGRSPFRDLLVYDTLLLPYFPNAKLDDIVALARDETDSFIMFNRYFTQRLAGIDKAHSVEEIRDIIDDIKYGVAQLRLEARKVSKTKLLRNAQLTFFAVTLGALVFLDGNLAKEIAGVSGSVNVLQLIQSQLQGSAQTIDLKKSDFFVPYVLSTKNSPRSG